MRPRLTRSLLPAAVLLSACSESTEPPPPTVASCSSADVGTVTPVAPFQARTFRGQELNRCVWVPGNASYVVMPQFASTGTRSLVRYALGNGGSLTPPSRIERGQTVSLAARLDNVLRQIEHQLAPGARRGASEMRALALSSQAVRGPSLQTVGSTRTFRVLSSIPANDQQQPTFATVTATLRFAGQNIYIYVDNQAPSGQNGFSDETLTRLGTWFDQDLHPIGVNTFGAPSDIDANGRVIVLMTPVVNGLTPTTNCNVVIAGFFFGLDLTQGTNSNRAEVFYSLVPDPQAQFSCARSVAAVQASAPPTFIHEFQHMISYNQHVIVRGGSDEDAWLNEGLSHIAEEVVARFYDNKHWPPPTPERLFTDTSNIFISNDLSNSYEYLQATPTTSLTVFESTGSLEERGAAWLFLRWLADQKDTTIFGRLVQTNLTSIANVENVAAESFPALFGDWSIALWTDSIVGHPRASVPARNRFKGLNPRATSLRVIYARLNTIAPTDFPRVYPLVLRPLAFASTVESNMYPGAMEHFQLTASPTDPAVGIRYTRPDGQTFADALKAQVGLFRLP
jgi:hypothetical protein